MTTSDPRRLPAAVPVRWTVAGVVVTALALLLALLMSGNAAPRVLGDPGALVRWGLPAALALHHVSLSVVVGALAFTRGILAPGLDNEGLRARLVVIAGWAAAIWAAAAAAVLVLTFADTVGHPLDGGIPWGEFGIYAWGTTPGRARVAVLAVALVVLLLSRWRGDAQLVALTLAASTVVPLSQDGHALSSHNSLAPVLLAGHVLGVAAWVGGVVVLGLVADLLRPGRAHPRAVLDTFRRFSRLAGIAYALVFATGVATAALRSGSSAALATPYGGLVLAKTAAMLGLGLIGFRHRRWITSAAASGSAPSAPAWRLIALEILIMGGTIALAVVLGRTAPPAA